MQRNSGHLHSEPYGDLVEAIETRLRVACVWLRIDSEHARNVVQSAIDWIDALEADEQLSLGLEHECAEACFLCALRQMQREGWRQ